MKKDIVKKVEESGTDETTRKMETWYLGLPEVIYDGRKCKHYWIQKTGTTAECQKCSLGMWGHAEQGKLKS